MPEGTPQVSYFKEGDQWTPRGAVLRCLINDVGFDADSDDDAQLIRRKVRGVDEEVHEHWSVVRSNIRMHVVRPFEAPYERIAKRYGRQYGAQQGQAASTCNNKRARA